MVVAMHFSFHQPAKAFITWGLLSDNLANAITIETYDKIENFWKLIKLILGLAKPTGAVKLVDLSV